MGASRPLTRRGGGRHDPGARRHPRARRDAGHGGAVLRDGTVRHGRRRDQGGGARRGLVPPHGRRPGGRQRGVQRREPRQAGPRRRPQGAARAGRAPASGGRRGRAGRELPPGRDGALRARLPVPGRGQPPSRLRLHLRLRADRAGRRPGRLRSGGPGRVRADVGDRRARPPAGQGRGAADGPRGRALRGHRHPGRPAAPHPHRPRPARRHRPRRRRGGALGVGGDGAVHERPRAPAAGVRAPDERAVPGGALQRRLHHARGGQRPHLPASRARAGPSGVARRPGLRERRQPRPPPAAAGGGHRGGHREPARGRTGWPSSTPTTSRAVPSRTTAR